LFFLVQKIFISEKISIYIVAFLLGIGTIIHELSHALFSVLLGGRVGVISLFPSKLEDGSIKFGHVEVEVLDPLRNTLVGTAPLIVGIGLILYLSSFVSLDTFDFWNFFILFLIFQISNAMYLSSSDLVYFKKIFFLSIIIFILLALGEYFIYDFFINYLDSFKIFIFSSSFKDYLDKLNYSFLFPLVINLILISIFKLFHISFHKRY